MDLDRERCQALQRASLLRTPLGSRTAQTSESPPSSLSFSLCVIRGKKPIAVGPETATSPSDSAIGSIALACDVPLLHSSQGGNWNGAVLPITLK